ncbi:MAG: hypothetical protein JJU21_17610 [Salinarimonas sp.]|nr:hypothetical protein [Salinarimonas sp.]
MPDIEISEGRIRFLFEAVDFAEKYDDWAYYRNRYQSACGSSKGVDFVVLKDKTVWLIEIKDFRGRRRSKAIDLAEEIAIKVRDTMSGILSCRFLSLDPNELHCAKQVVTSEKLRVVVHVEQPANPSRLFPRVINPAVFKLKLKQILKFADHHPLLVDLNSFPAVLGRADSISGVS